MAIHTNKVILKLLIGCTLRNAYNYDSYLVEHVLNNAPSQLKKLKKFLPKEEYEVLNKAYKTYKKTNNSSHWWKALNKLIEEYEAKPSLI